MYSLKNSDIFSLVNISNNGLHKIPKAPVIPDVVNNSGNTGNTGYVNNNVYLKTTNRFLTTNPIYSDVYNPVNNIKSPIFITKELVNIPITPGNTGPTGYYNGNTGPTGYYNNNTGNTGYYNGNTGNYVNNNIMSIPIIQNIQSGNTGYYNSIERFDNGEIKFYKPANKIYY